MIEFVVSVYPPQKHGQQKRKEEIYQLYAVNESVIATYGTVTLQLNLRLRKEFGDS